jgi:hypothetical protein
VSGISQRVADYLRLRRDLDPARANVLMASHSVMRILALGVTRMLVTNLRNRVQSSGSGREAATPSRSSACSSIRVMGMAGKRSTKLDVVARG